LCSMDFMSGSKIKIKIIEDYFQKSLHAYW